MDPATVERLYQIDQAIQRVANAKLQQEQLLDLFWEHMPPIDPEELAKRMQDIQDCIRELDSRKRALLEEREALIVQGAFNNRRGNGNNGGN
jgi:hypothetical protein